LQALQILETLIIKDSDKLDIRNKQAVRYCLLKQSKLQRLHLPYVLKPGAYVFDRAFALEDPVEQYLNISMICRPRLVMRLICCYKCCCNCCRLAVLYLCMGAHSLL